MAQQILKIDIDATDVQKLVNEMQANMTPKAFESATAGIMRRTGKKVGAILRKELPQDYEVKAGQVKAATKSPRVTGMSCTVPVEAERRHIGGGGNGFPASGGAHGWASLHRKYRVKTRIYKGVKVSLPTHMKSYGGQPPFRNLSAPSLHGLTFTRLGKKRNPITPVVGIAIPQMPMNRSQDDVQEEVQNYLMKETEHRYMALMRFGR